MYAKSLILAIAGLTAAKPIEQRQINGFGDISGGRGGGGGGGDNNNVQIQVQQQQVQAFDFGNKFNEFSKQERVVQIQEQNLQIVDNGRKQAVIQQAREVLIVDQGKQNFNNLFRKANMRNQNKDKATVMLVVQEINIAVEDGRGGVFQQRVFAQSAVVANRGAEETQTVQVVDQRKLEATQVLGGFGQGGKAGATPAPIPAGGNNGKNNNVALFGEMPQWDQKADDPAAGADAWQAELEDLQDANNLNNNNDENAKAAEQEKAAAEQAKQQQQAQNQTEEQQQAAEEQQKAAEEQQKAAEEQQAAGEQQDAAAQQEQQQENGGQAAETVQGEEDQADVAADEDQLAQEQAAKGQQATGEQAGVATGAKN